MCHVVHLLCEEEVGDLVPVIIPPVVLHHGIRELRHGGLCSDDQVAEIDVCHRLVTLTGHRYRLHLTVCDLIGCNDADACIHVWLGEIHRRV